MLVLVAQGFSDFTEVEALDIFNGLSLSRNGYAPSGYASFGTVNINSCRAYMNNNGYNVDVYIPQMQGDLPTTRHRLCPSFHHQDHPHPTPSIHLGTSPAHVSIR